MRITAEGAPAFDMDRFIAASRQLDLSGITVEDAGRYPLSPAEVRAINYVQDTEFLTVLYMKALLSTRALADPEARAFLVMWGYEECSHGRALCRLLEACGLVPSRRSSEQFTRRRGWLEIVQDVTGRVVSAVSDHSIATQMVWGAMNERIAIHTYTRIADQTANPILAEVVRRIIKDERRHYAFYYQQARRRLAVSPVAARLARLALQTLWTPVGGTMASREETDFVSTYLFDGDAGRDCLRDVDDIIRRLPRMDGFELVERRIGEAIARVHRAGVPVIRPQRVAS